MARPVIATKLYVPKLRPGLVTRPRLRERIRRGAESRLTLVSAPAGFGKTTLLAEWLDETAGEDHSVAWLSLDPEDSEPASFWTCVVTALQTAPPGEGSSAHGPVPRRQAPACYKLRVDGHLDDHWSAWFGDLTLIHESDGTTSLSGPTKRSCMGCS